MRKLVPEILLGLCLGLSAQAQVPPALNFGGALYTSAGAPVSSSNVSFKIEIWDKNLSCVLYSEQHLGLDLSANKGAFSFPIGTGTSQANNLEGGTAFDAKLFQNYGATGTFNGCVGGVTNASNDNRLIRVYYDTSGGTTYTRMTPDIDVTSAPYAMIAETLQGKTPANFVLTNVNSFLGQASVENIFSNTNYPVLTSLLAGNSNLYMSSSPTGPVSFHNQLLTNIANPTAAQDAATKNYVDGSVGGQTFDPTGVGLGVGNGKTIVWDAGLNKWVTANVGGVSSVGTGTGLVGGPITSSGTISVDVGTAANKIVQLNGSAQLPAVDGSLLTNINSSRLGGQPVSAAVPTVGQILTYNNSQWTPATNNAITALSGDVVSTGPGAVTSAIQPNTITSAKINNSGNAVNRLLITNASDGSTVTYATCTLVGEVMQWTALGWACADPATFLGTTGVVADTYGNGTQVPQVTVDATGRVQSLTNVNIAFPVVSVAGHTGVVTLNATDIGGLGTAALQNVGVVASDVLQLNGSAQIPAVDGSLLTNINATKLGTRSVSNAPPSPGQVLTWNSSNSDWEPSSVASSGTVLSVQAGVGMTGGPITSSGSLNVDVGVTANKIVQLNGSAQLPAVDGSLLTNVNTSKLGTRAVSSSAPSPGQVLAWNSTNSDWEPTAAATGAVTSVQAGVGMTGGPITSTGSLNVDVGVTANKIVQLNGSAQLPAVDGSLLTNVNVSSLIGKSLSSVGPSAGQVLTYNNTTGKWDAETSQAVLPSLASADIWVGNGLGAAGAVAPAGDVAMDNGGNFTVKALQGKAVSNAVPGAGQVLTYNSTTSQWDAETAQGSSTGFVNGGNTFAANSSLGNKDTYSLSFLTNNSARMVIDKSGNVGIGTSSPANTLTLNGSAVFNLPGAVLDMSNGLTFDNYDSTIYTPTSSSLIVPYDESNNPYPVIRNNDPQDGVSATLVFRSVNSAGHSTEAFIAGVSSSNGYTAALVFDQQTGANAYSERMRIDQNGNVGIGTAAPQALLDVAGTGTFSAIIVPRDTTANRPAANSVNGMIRYNTTLATLESYINGSWQALATSGGSNSFATDATFTGAGTGLAVTNAETVGGNLTVGGAAVLNGGATVAGGALNMSSQNITNVGAGVIGAGALSIAAGGTNQNLVLSGSGSGSVLLSPNVGIGSASPVGTLDVEGGTASAGSGSNIKIVAQNGKQSGNTNGGNLLLMAGSGHGASGAQGAIGLNTTSPDSAFNVEMDGAIKVYLGTLTLVNSNFAQWDATDGSTYSSSSSSAQSPHLEMASYHQNALDNSIDAFGLDVSNTSSVSQQLYVGAVANSGSSTYAPSFVVGQQTGANSYAERMRIDQNGNVGIGTISPQSTLDVNGVVHAASGMELGTSGSWIAELQVEGNGNSDPWGDALIKQDYSVPANGGMLSLAHTPNGGTNGNNDTLGIINFVALNSASQGKKVAQIQSQVTNAASGSEAGNLTFSTMTGGTLAPRITIYSGGNVGIGTSTPGAILDVYASGVNSAMLVPRDSSGNRPTAAVNGMIRYNTSIGSLEAYMASSWQPLSGGGGSSFTSDSTFSGAGTGLAVTNTETVGGNLTVSGASVMNGGATVAGGALNMSSQNITNVGAGITGAGALSIAAGGTNQNLVLSGSGSGNVLLNPNVGIGTASPAGTLDVEGGTASAGSGTNINLYAQNGKQSGGTNGGNIVLMPGNKHGSGSPGFVGIGTSTPGNYYLQAMGTVNSTLFDSGSYSSTSSSASFPQGGNAVGFLSAVNTQGGLDGVFSTLELAASNSSGNFQSMYMGAVSNAGGGVYAPSIVIGQSTGSSAYTERMRIDQNGNIGIGTASPSIDFEVYRASAGAAAYVGIVNNATTSSTTANLIAATGSTNANVSLVETDGAAPLASILSQNGNTGGLLINNIANSPMAFDTNNMERLRITAAGNVGIGTTTPVALLDIYGVGTLNSAMLVPRDTSGNRPTAAVNGMLRYNTSLGSLEAYMASSWQSLSGGGGSSFTSDSTFSGAGTGLAVTNTETVGGNLTVSGASVLNGGATIAGGALNMSSQNITNVGAGVTGAGALSIAAGGTNQNLTLSGSGTGNVILNPNVGIGTSSPAGTLDVEGGTAASGNGSSIYIDAQNGSTSGVTNGGNIILMPGAKHGTGTNGFVGIGTTSPLFSSSALEIWQGGSTLAWFGKAPNYSGVNGSFGASGEITAIQFDSAHYTSTSSTSLYPGGLTGYDLLGQNNSTTDGSIATLGLDVANTSSVNQSAYIGVVANTGAATYTPSVVIGQQTGSSAYTERIRIDQNGNVGIGTSTPGKTLDVNGTLNASGTWTGPNGFSVINWTTLGNAAWIDLPTTGPSGIGTGGAGANAWVAYSKLANQWFTGVAAGDVNYRNALGKKINIGIDNGGGTASPTMTFSTSNVGIGTTAPGAILDVNGTGTNSAMLVPRDTSGNRPTAAVNGMLRYNTSLGSLEAYMASSWQPLSGGGGSSFTSDSTFSGAGTGLAVTNTAIIGGNLTVSGTENVNGAINVSGVNGISFPADSYGTGASIAIGYQALQEQPLLAATQFQNTAVGYQTMSSASMTTGAVQNTALGHQALASLTSGEWNTAVGYTAGLGITGGIGNTAIGWDSLDQPAGNGNTAVGQAAGAQTNNANNTVYVGMEAGYQHYGDGNTGVGANALYGTQTSGAQNTALGYQAGYDITTGSHNIFIGDYATTGVGITSGSNNIIVGQNVRPPSKTASNQLNVGNLIYATGLGSSTTASTGNVGIGTSTPAAMLDIYGTGTLNSAMLVPRDTSGNRPTAAVNGMLRYNTSLGSLEAYMASSWQPLLGGGGSSFTSDSTFSGAGTGLAVTNTETVGGNLTVSGASVLNGGATIAGGALNMSSQNITNVGAGVTGAGALSIAAGGTNQNLLLSGSGTGSVLLTPNVGIGTSTPTAILQVATAAAASKPELLLSGNWFSGGSTTTTKPQLLIEKAGTSSAAWSTAGTGVGINAPSGFTGNLIDFQINGGSAARVDYQGNFFGTAFVSTYDYTGTYTGTSAGIPEPTGNNEGLLVQNQSGTDNGIAEMDLLTTNAAGNSQQAYIATVSVPGSSSHTPNIVIGQQTGGTAYAERMRIDQNGNVGIGTISPAASLQVAGEIQAGNTGLVCGAATKGAMRYNNTTSVMEYCNGTGWTLMQGSTCTTTTPTAFSFNNLSNQSVSTLVQSNIVQVSGFNCNVSTSVSGAGTPSYRICSDSGCVTVVQGWTTGPSSATSGQYIQLQQTTSAVGGASLSATIIVGNGASVWSASTTGSCAGLPGTPPAIGTMCADGTIYAGSSPDTGVPMFTTSCDYGQTWNGVTCTGTGLLVSWDTSSGTYTTTSQTSLTTGKANSTALVGFTTGGGYVDAPFVAAADCNALSTSGITQGSGNWYLPSVSEMQVLQANASAIGHITAAAVYWTSSEISNPGALGVNSSTGASTTQAKTNSDRVRCVRR